MWVFQHQEEPGDPCVQGPVSSLGTPLSDSGDLLPSSVGRHALKQVAARGQGGRLKQRGVNV